MTAPNTGPLCPDTLLGYFEDAFKPRERWLVGMEIEKMGRDAEGRAIPYDGDGPSVHRVLESYRDLRGGKFVLEGDHPIGIDGEPWGTISLEPAGQVEWSSKPQGTLATLAEELDDHVDALARAGAMVGVNWLETAVEPDLPLEAMPWMPKARYGIMRPYMGAHGRLAHRMMTQTASIQCAYDFADDRDWTRKFRAAALMGPVAVALFANSPRIDGRDTGFRSYRTAIWRETDPDRCGLPAAVFEDGFGIERWVSWLQDVPAMFLRRARGLFPADGIPFRELLLRTGCDALESIDWELHLSGVFTDVRSYRYLEVRTADLVSDDLAIAVPALWVGLLYDDDALDGALDLGTPVDTHDRWETAMMDAARRGLDAEFGGRPLREIASEALRLAARGLRGGAPCAAPRTEAGDPAEYLAGVDTHHRLDALAGA